MTHARRTAAQPSTEFSGAWFATPVLVAALAAGAALLPSALGLSHAVAAQQPAATFIVPSLQSVIVASPQPGEGESALDPYQLPQSY